MKTMIILFIISMFIACGGEVSSDGNKKSSNTNTGNANTGNTNTNGNSNTNNQTIDPGGFGPPVQDSGISKPKV